jgi:hypothetical protein
MLKRVKEQFIAISCPSEVFSHAFWRRYHSRLYQNPPVRVIAFGAHPTMATSAPAGWPLSMLRLDEAS